MSWTISAIGKSDALAVKLAADFAAITYLTGPEVGVKDAAAVVVAAALNGQVPATAVKVSASGSQSAFTVKDGPTSYTNSLKIEIEPIYGFVG